MSDTATGTSTPLTQQISDRTTDNEISTPKHELTSLNLQRSIIDSAAHGRTRDWDQRRLKSLSYSFTLQLSRILGSHTAMAELRPNAHPVSAQSPLAGHLSPRDSSPRPSLSGTKLTPSPNESVQPLDLMVNLKRSETSVVKTRVGSVLSRGFILKTDYHPSGQYPLSPTIQALITSLVQVVLLILILMFMAPQTSGPLAKAT